MVLQLNCIRQTHFSRTSGRLKLQHISLEVDEDFAGLGAVGGAEDAHFFEVVDDVGGAVVAEAEAALEVARCWLSFPGG